MYLNYYYMYHYSEDGWVLKRSKGDNKCVHLRVSLPNEFENGV